jgi:hypothetical protein
VPAAASRNLLRVLNAAVGFRAINDNMRIAGTRSFATRILSQDLQRIISSAGARGLSRHGSVRLGWLARQRREGMLPSKRLPARCGVAGWTRRASGITLAPGAMPLYI